MTCSTRYPILMIHGAGFRDRKFPRYWGRIPKALEQRGARVCYGHQDAWSSVERSAAVLRESLQRILAETGCDKVNIIAHSKGGLDARYMISSLGMAPRVASLTAIASPNHGSKTVDLAGKLPRWILRSAAACANLWFYALGDKQPDIYSACRQITTANIAGFNERNPDAPGVYYQSYAAVMRGPCSDVIMSVPWLVVKAVEGENDGMVTPASAAWGNFRGVLRGATGRGISHSDEVDLRRMNFTRKVREGGVSDIRQVYVDIVAELKEMGF